MIQIVLVIPVLYITEDTPQLVEKGAHSSQSPPSYACGEGTAAGLLLTLCDQLLVSQGTVSSIRLPGMGSLLDVCSVFQQVMF